MFLISSSSSFMAAYLLVFLVFLSTLCSAQRNSQTLLEVQALTSFKLSIHDPLGALTDWDSSSPFAPCDWRGVFCVNGRVGELRLPHLQLSGPLTTQIGNLRMLRKLSLRSNFFNGTVPASLSKCTLLHSVFLQGNAFSGNLPPEIFNLTDLQIFKVAGNQLSGEIPGELPQSLRYFDLSSNLFSGDIPRKFSDRSQLLLINLSYNRFSGEIPASLGRLQQLQYLWLAYNNLVGTLPSAIANCSLLVHLSAEGNAIGGLIPAAIAALPKLQVISLSHNNLSGSLPASLFCNVSIYPPSLSIVQLGFNAFTNIVKQESSKCFSSLQILDLQHNQIHGEFPLILTNISALTSLDVSWNLFSGNIPSAIGNLWRLEELRMTNNSFEGALPFEITNCSDLKVLDLEGNRMTGDIPMFLGDLRSLKTLSLGRNQFSGSIPSSFRNLSNLENLNLGGNGLNGRLPEEVMGLSNLSTLNLSGNKFSGSMPVNIGNLQQLSVLNLSKNGFSGTIPSSIGTLYKLAVVDLSGQNFSGNIPESLSRLSNLTVLDLSTNNFTGEIPANLTMLSSLVSFNVSNNNLGGQIPEMLGSRFNNSLNYAGNQGLCGEPLERRCETSGDGGNKLIMFIAVAASGALLLLSCCCLYTYNFLRWRRKIKEKAAGEKKHSPARASSRTSGGRGSGENGGPKLVMFNNKITLAETIEATREFDEEHVLSRTHYGVVYKACYNDGMVLSIRRLSNGSLGENTFRKEAESLGRVKHRNLTVLRGYYAGPPNLRLLVHDYMPNGNLATLLQEASHQDGHVLNWPMRHLIALGIARGLAFLHSSSMVHGDVKPQNVLFDADFEAHLSEFGLGKLVVATPTEPSTSTSVGTLGYISPEVALTGETTRESDAYSFGIVLLELLTGKRPLMFTQDEDIVKWVKRQLQRGQISELLEPGLLELDPESSEWEEFLLGIKVGLLCTAPDPLDRPTMADIVFMLEGCRVGPDIASSADPTCQPSPA
ncbi:hypothetical protein AABB24_024762 [Solanum stoloniferum]|uniref:Protein kinase domain-containing protein n=1 Tax=Solanum stoloniferum TaxID=62892 RepID=A0ABD2SQ89_9SOLN